MRQTVFTPTYNRAKTLPRVYESLKTQTYKDFEWLIIDDGSSDNTEEVVNSFLEEAILSIRYVKKENGGKWTAFRMALEICKTPYMTSIDSDDTLESNAVETFENHWKMIEENLEDVAVISMYTKSVNNSFVGIGNYTLDNQPYKDITWHDLVLRKKDYRELVSSRDVSKTIECLDYNRWPNLLNDKCKFIGEALLWSSIGKKYKTRVINQVGRIYYCDADNSILRGKKNENMLKSIMWTNFYLLKENISWYWINPRYFMSVFIHMDWARQQLGVSVKELLRGNKSILYFLSLVASMVLNKIKK